MSILVHTEATHIGPALNIGLSKLLTWVFAMPNLMECKRRGHSASLSFVVAGFLAGLTNGDEEFFGFDPNDFHLGLDPYIDREFV